MIEKFSKNTEFPSLFLLVLARTSNVFVLPVVTTVLPKDALRGETVNVAGAGVTSDRLNLNTAPPSFKPPLAVVPYKLPSLV